jgi:hypothetical protein
MIFTLYTIESNNMMYTDNHIKKHIETIISAKIKNSTSFHF